VPGAGGASAVHVTVAALLEPPASTVPETRAAMAASAVPIFVFTRSLLDMATGADSPIEAATPGCSVGTT